MAGKKNLAGSALNITPPQDGRQREWLRRLWQAEWGGDWMVSRGHKYNLEALQALLAQIDGNLVGAVTYRIDGEQCEVMSLNATQPGGGIGTSLLWAVENGARSSGCRRVWCITSNDNVEALKFYQRRGYRMVAVYPGAIDDARRLKPTIPVVGAHDIPIHDEIELSKTII